MTSIAAIGAPSPPPRPRRPFFRWVLRGLGVLLPPLLTIVILLWIVRTIVYYVLEPVTDGARAVLASQLADIRPEEELAAAKKTTNPTIVELDGRPYKRLSNGQYVPLEVYQTVEQNLGAEPMPATGRGIYDRYIELTYLQPYIAIPIFLVLFLGLMYLLGSFLAVGIGRALWNGFERAFYRVPLFRNVYSSVKQVTDFMVKEKPVQFHRVVAVEYPCQGVWSVAFVTGEGISEVRAAAGEALLTLLVPTSPMPLAGYTVLARRREVVDLDLTVDQACQYIISCGVVVPPPKVKSDGSRSIEAPVARGAH
jgi:uncharacterized membrane protein